ncbi:hypothetical protein MW887_000886 [Aspergillus wentii]|nr:hypothetical protein MW887_000886 [Aspergillus wentii]
MNSLTREEIDQKKRANKGNKERRRRQRKLQQKESNQRNQQPQAIPRIQHSQPQRQKHQSQEAQKYPEPQNFYEKPTQIQNHLHSSHLRKSSQPLPKWYHRVCTLIVEERREVEPEDFHEDIDDDSENEYYFPFEVPEDIGEAESESEYIYDGSDAVVYYDLKEQREDRREEVEGKRKEKQRDIDEEAAMEKDIKNGFKSLNIANQGRVTALSLADAHFEIHLEGWMQYCNRAWGDVSRTKYIEFYHLENGDQLESPGETSTDPEQLIYGHIYFDASNECSSAPFDPPARTGSINHLLQNQDGKYELYCQFLSQGHLRLQVSRDLFFKDEPPPSDAPEFLEFMGLRCDMEREMAKREQVRAQIPQPPSRRESWFERSMW